jgi:hypothetical protein
MPDPLRHPVTEAAQARWRAMPAVNPKTDENGS